MTDALRDAELLADALLEAMAGGAVRPAAFGVGRARLARVSDDHGFVTCDHGLA